jgi:hypothetical protein
MEIDHYGRDLIILRSPERCLTFTGQAWAAAHGFPIEAILARGRTAAEIDGAPGLGDAPRAASYRRRIGSS